jgi:hypothetical protein
VVVGKEEEERFEKRSGERNWFENRSWGVRNSQCPAVGSVSVSTALLCTSQQQH